MSGLVGDTAVSKFGRVPQLDGLRAIAILLVFLGHALPHGIFPGGFGVTIFFFLSGYLITSLLRAEYAQKGRVEMAAFYIRRTIRIWPPLYITLGLALVACAFAAPSLVIDPLAVAAQFTFVINYAHLWGHGDGVPAMPLWSLAVEEHFYLVFPLAFICFIARMSSSRAALLLAIACAVVLLLRIFTALVVGDLYSI